MGESVTFLKARELEVVPCAVLDAQHTQCAIDTLVEAPEIAVGSEGHARDTRNVGFAPLNLVVGGRVIVGAEVLAVVDADDAILKCGKPITRGVERISYHIG